MVLYNIKRHIRKFDTDESEEMSDYEDILNNPLCSIISSYKEKLTTKTSNHDGSTDEDSTVVLVVTWEERVLV